MADPPPVYDRIGRGYTAWRQPDPRIARRIEAALGGARTVVNVGAGTGSYEPAHLEVVAVEPSEVMIAQRRSRAPLLRAVAEALPLADASFDAALAVLTVHHWTDWRLGITELRRVAASRVVILTWDVEAGAGFWLFDYFPAILAFDRRRFASIEALCREVGGRAEPVPIAHDCLDGFLGSRWRSPEAYLDASFRRPMSGFAQIAQDEVARGVERLEREIADGMWERRFGELRDREELDLGYRLVVAELS